MKIVQVPSYKPSLYVPLDFSVFQKLLPKRVSQKSNNAQPYLAECFVIFKFSTTNDSTSTWHTAVDYAHLPAFKSSTKTNIQIDFNSCRQNSNDITFNLVSYRPEPFVWIESTSGIMEDNLVLINQKETSFCLKSSNLNCDSIKSLRLFYPSMVSDSNHF